MADCRTLVLDFVMRPTYWIILFLAMALIALLVSLERADSQISYLLGAAEIPGQFGARFSSTLTLTNVSPATTTVQIGFIPYAGKPVPSSVSRSVASGETLRIPSVLQTLFGLSSDAGTLALTSDGWLVLSLVTANIANPSGTYGLALQPIAANTLLPAGSMGHAIWASQGSGYRTNVALVLLDPDSSVQVMVYDEQNQLRGSTTISSPVPISWQVTLPELIGQATLSLGRVEFRVLQGRAAGYTAVVDNVTGDGIAVMAERVNSDMTDLLLNGVARTPGVNHTHWSTDIRIFNPNETTVDVSVGTLGISGSNSTFMRSVPPFGLIEIVDILGANGFGYPDGVAGALRLRAGSPFLLAARTNNLDPTGNRPGSFSAFERAVPFSGGLISAPNSAVFAGIDQISGTTGFRTNLAFLAGPNGAAGTLLLRDSLGGEQTQTAFSLSPGQWIQKNVVGWFPRTSIPGNARVDVKLTGGSLDGYASRVDNGTGDAVVVPLALLPAATGNVGNGPTIAGCPVFPSDNPWNRDISNDPIDPNSDNYIAHMNGNSKFLHADFGSDPTYGIPYVIVPGTQPKVPMTFDYADESDPGPYPISPDAPIEGGANSTGDRHILVVDKDNCLLYETFDSHFIGPGWHCGSGAIFDLRSNRLRPDYWTSADAAGLPIFPGLARYDEAVAGGEIKHALRFTVQSTQRAFIHPATHFASSNTDPNAPPMGLRVRLKASYDLSRFNGTAKVILIGLKKYGMMVADNGSDWFITGATDSRWNDDDLNQLKTVPGNAFEVVQTGPIIK